MSLIVRPQPGQESFQGLPKRHYGFVFADPNWTYEAYSGDGGLEDWPSLWAPLGRHSAKPDAMFRRCEAYGDGPYLELYSRRTQPGWDAWGLEAGRFDDGQLARPAKVLSAEGLPLFGRVA